MRPAAMQCDDERELLRLVATGDQHALRCLYAAYRPRLWSYLSARLDGDAGWTEELTQDVFLAVWRSAATFRGEARPATWLFRIAHNLAANARRARQRRPQVVRLDAVAGAGGMGYDGATPPDADADGCGDLLAAVSHEDGVLDRLTLASALSRLSFEHRAVLELAFVQGFSTDEIGTILGVPPGTVKSRLSYARRALHAQLRTEACAGHDTFSSPDNVAAAGTAEEKSRGRR